MTERLVTDAEAERVREWLQEESSHDTMCGAHPMMDDGPCGCYHMTFVAYEATREALMEAAGVFLSVVTLENPHRYENSPAERLLRDVLSQLHGKP